MAPTPSARTLMRAVLHPRNALSEAVFAVLHGITSRYDASYPCSAPDAGGENQRSLLLPFAHAPGVSANDGVVPTHSQIWGKLVWAGYGDHLDVIGHFHGPGTADSRVLKGNGPPHVDWLLSGSDFDSARFASLMDAIAGGLLSSARSRRR